MREQYEPAVKFFEQALTQPSLNNDITNETRIKMEAVKNYVEYQANKGNEDFQTPKIAARGQRPEITERQSTVKLAGIIDEQGRFTPILVIYASDQQMAEIYLKYMTEIQFTPAKKKGAPVPIWLSMEFQSSVSVRVGAIR